MPGRVVLCCTGLSFVSRMFTSMPSLYRLMENSPLIPAVTIKTVSSHCQTSPGGGAGGGGWGTTTKNHWVRVSESCS